MLTRVFLAEHVFEFQTLILFVEWLTGTGTSKKPNTPTGYTMPSRQWVEKYLLYYQGGSNTGGTSFTFQSARLGAGAVGQNYFWNYMVRGLGDGINQLDLVLANAGMNGKKAKLFGLSQPAADQGDMRSSMIGVRDTAAVFKYLDYTPVGGGEWMWNKFMRPSNWVDLVCNDFDAAYAAATLNANRRPAGEPRYNDPQTGARVGKMRWLWKAFIDNNLATLETKASAFCTAAAQNFVVTPNNPNPKYLVAAGAQANAAWANNAFGAAGWCTATSMRLPRVAGQPGTWGAYGNAAQTVNAAGAVINPPLGAPAP